MSVKIFKNAAKDFGLFFLVITGIGLVQMFYFQSKDVPPAVFADSYASLDGVNRSIVQNDKYSFVYAFAPWCGVCKMSASNINGLKDHFHTVAVALSYDQESDLRSFVDHTGLDVPVILGQGKLENALNVGQFPTYFILNDQGKIVLGWSGYTTSVGIWLRLWGVRLFGSLWSDR